MALTAALFVMCSDNDITCRAALWSDIILSQLLWTLIVVENRCCHRSNRTVEKDKNIILSEVCRQYKSNTWCTIVVQEDFGTVGSFLR